MRRMLPFLLIVLLSGCPQPDDPGRTERTPAPRIVFPADSPAGADRIRGYLDRLAGGNRAQLRWATRQLARLGEEGVVALDRALAAREATNVGFVQNALEALEAIGLPSGSRVAAPWMTHESSIVRERAAEALGACGGPDATAPLVRGLDDAEPRVVGRVLVALAALRSEEGAREVLARRERWGPGLSGMAVHALVGPVRRAAMPWLRTVATNSSNLEDRLAAAEVLLELGDGTGARSLAGAARDAPDAAWADIVGALLEWDAPEGRLLLEAGLASEEPERRAAAFGVSVARPSAGRVEDLLAALGSENQQNRRLAMRHAGEWILAGHREVEEVLLGVLADEAQENWRDVAANELVEVGRPDLLDRLREELLLRPGRGRGVGSQSYGLGRALAKAGEPGLERLRTLVDEENPVTVSGALAGLEAALSTEASADVARVLWHQDRDVRLEAARALGRIGRRRDVAEMRRAFEQEQDPVVRAALATSASWILNGEDGG